MSTVSIRTALPGDSRALWTIRNDPSVRSMFFDTAEVPWDDHQKWFSARLSDPATRFFVAEESELLGSVRYTLISAGTASTSISLAPSARGRGLATRLLVETRERIFADGFCSRVIAEIKPDNAASLAAFTSAGFVTDAGGSSKDLITLVSETDAR